jgi:hypothetical protein
MNDFYLLILKNVKELLKLIVILAGKNVSSIGISILLSLAIVV